MRNPPIANPTVPANGEYDGTTFAGSGIMGTDTGQAQSFDLSFTTPGTYHYICVVHGGANKNNPVTNMEGDIVVEAAAAAVQSPAAASSSGAGSGSGSASASPAGASVAARELSHTGGPALLGWGLVPLLLGLAALKARRRP